MASADKLYLLILNEYMGVAAVTCTFLETIATLPDEIAFVWPQKWCSMKVLFLANKYMTLGDALFKVVDFSHMMHVSEDACSVLFQVYCYCYVAGSVFSELILVARTLALWGFNRYMVCFVVLATIQLIPEVYYVTYQWAAFVEFTSRPSSIGCFTGVRSQDAWPAFVAFGGIELFIIVLTLIKQLRDGHFSSSTDRDDRILVKTLYRDGTVCWMVILVFSIANLLAMLVAPVELSNCMHGPLRTVHGALCTRVLLNLRKAAEDQCPTNAEITLVPTLVFDHPGELDDPSCTGLEEVGGQESIPENQSRTVTQWTGLMSTTHDGGNRPPRAVPVEAGR